MTKNTSFSDYVSAKEAAATPQRRAEMDAARAHAKVLYNEHFGLVSSSRPCASPGT